MKELDKLYPIPNWWWFASLLFGIPGYIVFVHYGQSARGFLELLSVGGMVFLCGTMWHMRRYKLFWVTWVSILVAHFFAIFSIDWKSFHFPGIVFTPFVVVDVYLSYQIILGVVRRYSVGSK